MVDMQVFPLDRTRGAMRVVEVVSCAVMALFCGAPTLYLLLSSFLPLVYDDLWAVVLMLLPMAAGACWFTGFFALQLERMFCRVTIDGEGVTLLRPLRKEKHYTWSDFQQVCICFASSVPKGPSTSVLCFVCHGEKKNLYDRWKTDNPWHYRRLIVADYTTEIEEAIRAVCPMEIKDLRGSIAYPDPGK